MIWWNAFKAGNSVYRWYQRNYLRKRLITVVRLFGGF